MKRIADLKAGVKKAPDVFWALIALWFATSYGDKVLAKACVLLEEVKDLAGATDALIPRSLRLKLEAASH